jgi:hypothetical protein
MTKRNHQICLITIFLGVVFYGIGFVPLANFFPPLSAVASAEEIAAIYQQNTFGIRMGTVFMQLGSAMILPLIALIALQMKRMEGTFPVLATTQVVSGSLNLLFFFLPPFIWTIAAFRPDRTPELTLLINDIGWLCFLMPIAPALIQNFSIGLAILSDKRKQPVFPRWLGYLNFFIGLTFVSDLLVTFFKTGPFAWTGLMAFYVPATMFFGWIFLMLYMLNKVIETQEDDVPTTCQ